MSRVVTSCFDCDRRIPIAVALAHLQHLPDGSAVFMCDVCRSRRWASKRPPAKCPGCGGFKSDKAARCINCLPVGRIKAPDDFLAAFKDLIGRMFDELRNEIIQEAALSVLTGEFTEEEAPTKISLFLHRAWDNLYSSGVVTADSEESMERMIERLRIHWSGRRIAPLPTIS